MKRTERAAFFGIPKNFHMDDGKLLGCGSVRVLDKADEIVLEKSNFSTGSFPKHTAAVYGGWAAKR